MKITVSCNATTTLGTLLEDALNRYTIPFNYGKSPASGVVVMEITLYPEKTTDLFNALIQVGHTQGLQQAEEFTQHR